jgi:hypothetical protein
LSSKVTGTTLPGNTDKHTPEERGTQSESKLGDLWKAYNTAVEHVTLWKNGDIRRLRPITPDADGTVEVVTATNAEIPDTIKHDVWVTVVPELQIACRTFEGDVAMQVRELLGLPPDYQIPQIVLMKVRATDIFRPTPDPSPYTICPCGNSPDGACRFSESAQCGNAFPEGVSPSHIQWIAETTFSVRQSPHGFPWTHLGYTYNWKPGADTYGASEYIVRKGANVTVESNLSPEKYCHP